MKIQRTLDNQPRSFTNYGVEHGASTYLLTNGRNKSGTVRRSLVRSRDRVVDYPRTEPKPASVKVAALMASLSFGRLLRRLHQSARKAATAKHLLVKMSPSSKFRRAMQAEQDRQLAIFQFVRAEIADRADGTLRTAHVS